MNVYVWTNSLKNAYIGEYGWKPWANTLLYVPFVDDLLDHSWNSVSLNTGWTITNTTLSWVKCASLTNWWLNTPTLDTTWNWTQTIWVKWLPTWSWDNAIIDKGNSSRAVWTWLKNWSYISSITGVWYSSSASVDTSNVWHLLTVVRDSWTLYIYYDWVQKLTYSISSYESWISNNFWIYKREWSSTFGNWYISGWIVENKARTAQEVQDYYNQTKWNYWL